MAEAHEDLATDNPVGKRLRAAREEKGLSLEDVAKQTRIPIRHLEHIERGEWDAMPAITYSVGFARSYANVVGLDGPSVGAELRQQLGGARNAAAGPAAYYEPADPARVPPRWIAIVAIVVAVLIVGGYLIWRSHAVGGGSDATDIVESSAPPAAVPATPRAQPSALAAAPVPTGGPVVLTASEDVWLRVSDGTQPKALFQGILKAGQRYEIPAAAAAPTLRTGRANVLSVTVGGTPVPPLGPPEKTIANVSLKASDLIARARGGTAPPAGGAQ
jgi:cytoskeletal protein RodZ